VENNSEKDDREKNRIQKQPVRKKRRKVKPRYGSELSLWSQFKFLAITTGVTILFISIGVWLTRDKSEVTSNNNSSPTPNNSSSITEPLDTIRSSNPSNQTTPNPDASLLPPLTTNVPVSNTPPLDDRQQEGVEEPIYKVVKQTNLIESKTLGKIVGNIVDLAKNNNLNTQELSITLIDVNTGEIAGYQQQKLRFPASVVKMFWLVELYNLISLKRVEDSASLKPVIIKMIKDSDNEAASEIVDLITATKSSPQTQTQDYQEWEKNRQWLNRFFANSNMGYEGINISQKTFPIPREKLPEPLGYDLKIRGDNLDRPIRNKISTKQVAQLMYEIATRNAIDSNYSQTLFDWLKWNLATEERKKIDPNTGRFNPIITYFGEALEKKNVIFASKAGWTSQTRQEVAYIATQDGKTKYILAVFAEDKAYAKNQKIFPQISKLVYQKMVD
jgi:Beta-lactamase enzyme family